MDATALKRLYLWSVVGFLALSALIAIWALLSGEFGETEQNVILTTLSISAASICAMACAAFIERRGHVAIGGAGIASAALAALLLIVAIWSDFLSGLWRATGSATIVAIAFAHALLLSIPALAHRYRWVQAAAVASITVLALMLVAMIYGDIDVDNYHRALGVVGVFVVLFTLLVPLCAKLGAAGEGGGRLVLYPDADGGGYRDRAGNRYVVTRETGGNAPTDA